MEPALHGHLVPSWRTKKGQVNWSELSCCSSDCQTRLGKLTLFPWNARPLLKAVAGPRALHQVQFSGLVICSTHPTPTTQQPARPAPQPVVPGPMLSGSASRAQCRWYGPVKTGLKGWLLRSPRRIHRVSVFRPSGVIATLRMVTRAVFPVGV